MENQKEKWYEKYVFVRTKSYIDKVPIEKVFAIERRGRKLLMITEKLNYEYYEKLENIEKYFGEEFIKCHGGCLINLKKIRSFRNQSIEFDNGYILALGRGNYIKAKQNYCSFIGGFGR